MDANVDLRISSNPAPHSKSTLHELIKKHQLDIAAVEEDVEFTWKRNKQKDNS